MKKNPLKKKSWNFKAVFRRNSARIPEVNIWNHSGILIEFHWNTIGILLPILSKFTAYFPELFRWNATHFWWKEQEFFWNFWGILMELLRYFDGIWVVFWWNLSGILMEFQSKKQCKRSYLQNLTSVFVEFFMFFLILLYPKRAWENPCSVGE